MADVARAPGGDAGGDPPQGPYRIPAPCEAATKKKGRGKATYKKLKDAYDKNGKKPLPIEFDMRDLRTFQSVGDNHSNFTRFIGTWIDLNVRLYYDRWNLVPEQYRVGLWSELQRYFDFAPFQAGPMWETVIARIKRLCHERYKSRKVKRKDHLMKGGGYADIESVRNKPPTNIDQDE